MTLQLTKIQAKRLWIRAQRLDALEPFGRGAPATQRAIEHLGYVQIDTINVIERCHHHILYNRIPRYRREDLRQAQAVDKSVFEYWTHALSYVPTCDFRFFMRQMQKARTAPSSWFRSVKPEEMRKVLRLIKVGGALSIRDIQDDVLVEKNHPWASRKPSKKALQLGFYSGRLVVSERLGMLKKYELTERHFGWPERPRIASEAETLRYLLERGLRSQGLISLESITHLNAPQKPGLRKLIDSCAKRGELLPVQVTGLEKTQFWIEPAQLDLDAASEIERVHLLSPFDPLVIQRKRLSALFDYDHRFEAYLPIEKRTFGYFALPVLVSDQIVAAIDLKTDRGERKLLMQKWTWLKKFKSPEIKKRIEEELHRFEKFQLAKSDLENVP